MVFVNRQFRSDRQWGYCNLGVSDATFYDICRSEQQILKCSPGYTIDIVSAAYAAKSDGSTTGDAACIYDQNDCFQNDDAAIQSTCAGRVSCIAFYFPKTLASCQNRPSAYFHVEYVCVPSTVQVINTYDLCSSIPMSMNGVDPGYLISPKLSEYGPQSQLYICHSNIDSVSRCARVHDRHGSIGAGRFG
ncbi:unnamed protein product [Sphagnum balticum]